MLPGTGWLPATADAEYTALDIPLPTPFVATYRDFSPRDPIGDLQGLDEIMRVDGPHTHVAEYGTDSTGVPSLLVELQFASVYGAILLDRLTTPGAWRVPAPRPDTAWLPCPDCGCHG